MLSELHILPLALAVLQISTVFADNGYHYDQPAQPILPLTQRITKTDGHQFAGLPTISPLPPVPALPPLPTGRPSTPHISSQSLIQIHPPPQNQRTASKSIANAYRPSSAGQYQTAYIPSNGGSTFSTRPLINPQPQQQPQEIGQIIYGQRIQTPPSPLEAAPQPLRIPFGKQAIVHLPPPVASGNDFSYELGGRKLKQYAVVEIIDNDIEQNNQPFLTTPFIDNYRARIGASGTGAVPPPLGQQIDSRSNALVMAQQRLAQPQGNSDAIALGSGGLGFVRLANGNVYLGSGSLGYVSGQQHSAFIQDARTRTGASMPDPLHFGHGPLGNPANAGGFRF